MVRMIENSTGDFCSPIFGLCFNSPEIDRKRTLSSPSAVPQVSLDSLFINHRPSHALRDLHSRIRKIPIVVLPPFSVVFYFTA
jgi:hypothetical protein